MTTTILFRAIGQEQLIILTNGDGKPHCCPQLQFLQEKSEKSEKSQKSQKAQKSKAEKSEKDESRGRQLRAKTCYSFAFLSGGW